VLKNIVWLSRKYNKKYVGFMAPLAKKVPDPCTKQLLSRVILKLRNKLLHGSCCFNEKDLRRL